MTLVTVLFHIIRYLPFFDGPIHLAQQFLSDPSRSTCNTLFHVYGWLVVFSILVANSVLVLRTYALWENKRNVALSLFALLVACIIGVGYFMEKFISSFFYDQSPSRSAFPGCFISQSGRAFWISYLLLLLFHNVILILTVIKLIKGKRLRGSSLLRTIYRDGIMFYAILSVLSLINIIMFNTTQTYLKFGFISFHRVLHAILTERLVINIRRAGIRPPRDSRVVNTTESSEELSRDFELSLLNERSGYYVEG